MDLIRDLLSIITRNKLKHLHILGQSAGGESSNLLDDLYTLLSNGGDHGDEEAARKLYGASPSDRRYRKLKSVLKYRLIDLLFLVDGNQAKYQEHRVAFQQAVKYLAASRIMVARGAAKSPAELLNKALDISLRNEFTDITVQCLKHLRNHFGLIQPDWKKYREYDERLKAMLSVQEAETCAEEYFILLARKHLGRSASQPVLDAPIEEILSLLENQMAQYDSFRLHFHGRMVQMVSFMNKHDYQSAASVCRDAIAFFEAKPFTYRIGLSSFANNLIICCTQLKRYDEGWKVLARFSTLYKKGHYNWFNQKLLHVTLCLHTARYDEGWMVYREVIKQGSASALPPEEGEKWTIIGAYLHYLDAVGKVNVPENEKRGRKFRISKFLNEVPVYSADKRGYNVAILIIQILLLIAQRSYQTALDRVEALGKYRVRYLRKDAQFRSNCFIQLVLLIPISGFHRKSVERRADKYLKKLESMPLELARQPYEAELIPFEKLWQIALDSLGTQFVRNRIYKKYRTGVNPYERQD